MSWKIKQSHIVESYSKLNKMLKKKKEMPHGLGFMCLQICKWKVIVKVPTNEDTFSGSHYLFWDST